MNRLIVQTRAGPLGVVGRVHTGSPRPALLAVNGAFPKLNQRHDLVDYFRGVSVLVVDLPGMADVPWAHPTIAELTGGLEETVCRLLGDVPIVAFGASVGNLLTLGLQLPNICHRLALEPFFQTEDLWPFVRSGRRRMAERPDDADLARFLWEVFGIGPERLENRDYRHLLANITVPTQVMVGGAPLLPPRELDFWPSFTSEEDRAALSANPLVSMRQGPPDSGHSWASDGPSGLTLKQVLHGALLNAAKLCT